MTQNQIIEIAKKAGFVTFEGEKGDIEFDTYGFTLAECLAKFAELIIASQPQPTPSKMVDERAEFEKAATELGLLFCGRFIDEHYKLWQARAQLSKPQPTSQGELYKAKLIISKMRKALECVSDANYKHAHLGRGEYTTTIIDKDIMSLVIDAMKESK